MWNRREYRACANRGAELRGAESMDDRLLEAVTAVAEQWRDPSHEAREKAVDKTLAVDNRFTEESTAFAVNHFMHQLTRENIEGWLRDRTAAVPAWIGAAPGGWTPMEGFRDLLAVLLTGHRYVGRPPAGSPALLPAFVEDLTGEVPDLDAAFVGSYAELFERASAVVIGGEEDTVETAIRRCEEADISSDRRFIRRVRYGMAVVDGEEDEEARSGLAEDMLLFEGESPCSVALLWAPINHSPDPYLAVLPQFREIYPPHDTTDGSLAMPRAFLEARDQGHAYGAGFLVSRGEPEVQRAAHIRWTEYDDYDAVTGYATAHRDEIALIVAEPRVGDRLDTELSIVEPGNAHRRPLEWDPHTPDLVSWLLGL